MGSGQGLRRVFVEATLKRIHQHIKFAEIDVFEHNFFLSFLWCSLSSSRCPCMLSLRLWENGKDIGKKIKSTWRGKSPSRCIILAGHFLRPRKSPQLERTVHILKILPSGFRDLVWRNSFYDNRQFFRGLRRWEHYGETKICRTFRSTGTEGFDPRWLILLALGAQVYLYTWGVFRIVRLEIVLYLKPPFQMLLRYTRITLIRGNEASLMPVLCEICLIDSGCTCACLWPLPFLAC